MRGVNSSYGRSLTGTAAAARVSPKIQNTSRCATGSAQSVERRSKLTGVSCLRPNVMATLKSRWLLSICLLSLSTSSASAGPPAPPSRPVCFIPCDDDCQVDIQCTWEPRPHPQTFTGYTLHWEPAHDENSHVSNGTSLNGRILRQYFSNDDDLFVWVEAKNQHGSARSEKDKFNTAEIFKPSPPKVTSSPQESGEVHWETTCEHLQHGLGSCDVQHRDGLDKDWAQVTGLHGSFMIEVLRPCTVYEFRVRCACDRGLMSDWSPIHTKQSTKGAPVGELDVWSDCGIFPETFHCVLTWKEALLRACGSILGYEVLLSYHDGSTKLVNVSAAAPGSLLVCEEKRCHFNASLKDASTVSVSAYNPHGANAPSHLTVPITGKEKNDPKMNLTMTEETLTASWTLPPDSVDLKEFVVQYKQAGSPETQGFDWVKVNKSQTTATFKGRFKKYTPYQVSLFALSDANQVLYRSSAVGFSVQGPPSIVPSFKEDSKTEAQVTLTWEPVPLLRQNGTILCYQIGVDKHEVFNVSSSQTSKQLSLSPGSNYKVWIRAVTVAGPGEKRTLTIDAHNKSVFMRPTVIGTFLVLACVVFTLGCVCAAPRKKLPLCFDNRVPDPGNSRIFRQVKNQFNDPLAWICIPTCEPHPKISFLDVVEIPSEALKSSQKKSSEPEEFTAPEVGDGCLKTDCTDDEDAECHRTEQRHGKEPYSKIVDSDEEKGEGEEEDRWSSSTEEAFESGYEKHFMPSAWEILEVT